jgi:hypothetical protein
MTTRQHPPTCQQIFNYWVNQQNCPWDGFLDEPACFACGFFKDDSSKSTSWTTWTKAGNNGLERCHIIPHSLGGSNTVDNFVLLCKKCHDLSPDIADSQFLFDWMKNCPRSFFGSHWTEVALWNNFFSSLTQKIPDEVAAWSAMDFTKQQEELEKTFDSVSSSSHFGKLSIGTLQAIVTKTIEGKAND